MLRPEFKASFSIRRTIGEHVEVTADIGAHGDDISRAFRPHVQFPSGTGKKCRCSRW